MAPTRALYDANNELTTLVFISIHTKKIARSEAMSDWQWKIIMNFELNFIPSNHQILD